MRVLPRTPDVFTSPRSAPTDPPKITGVAATTRLPQIPRSISGVAVTKPLAMAAPTQNLLLLYTGPAETSLHANRQCNRS